MPTGYLKGESAIMPTTNPVQVIAQHLQNRPTILDFAEELQTIADLQAVAPEQAAADWDAFSAVVSRLRDSHQINGIFCLTPQHRPVFIAFAGYLKTVADIAGQDAAPLCDGFGLSAAEIDAAFAAKRKRC